MGCDIHSCVEYYKPDCNSWFLLDRVHFLRSTGRPFTERNYELFAFLGYTARTTIDVPQCDSYDLDMIENEVSQGAWNYYYDWRSMAHNVRAVNLKELVEFDYDAKRVDKNSGSVYTLKAILGDEYFNSLEVMKNLLWDLSEIRVVYWFDN